MSVAGVALSRSSTCRAAVLGLQRMGSLAAGIAAPWRGRPWDEQVRRDRRAANGMVPPGRLELPPPAPEAGALSTELRGRGYRSIPNDGLGRREVGRAKGWDGPRQRKDAMRYQKPLTPHPGAP